MKDRIAELLQQAVDTLKNDGVYPPEFSTEITVENARDKGHGDFATNLAMKSCKPAGMKPRDLAERLVSAIPQDAAIAQVDIAGPGFINFFISDASSFAVVEQILQQGDGYGRSKSGNGEKVQVEFVSANPTGPLHVGHGRGAAIGDCICRLLEATGHDVTREFYYNDAGAQIDNLARSVQARAKGLTPEAPEWPADGYRGEYILDVAEAYRQQATVTADDREVTAKGDVDDLEAIKAFAVAWLRREQDLDLKAFGVQFDVYFLESSLYQEGKVEEAVEALQTNGYTYEQDGALWLRTTDFGDDKDRVMRKSDGDYTYFVPDVAYHLNKWQRGYTTVINEQGADHHSTITRVRAGLQGLHAGIPAGWPDYVLHQMVTVTRSGEEVKISKRAGSYVTVRDLIEEVGRDATRYFLAARRAESQLTFDIDLARSRSNENPVYYIQYAHARICSMLRKLTDEGDNRSPEAFQGAQEALELDTERDLANTLARYPDLVQYAARQHEPHQLAQYLRDLAGEFHTYYNAHKVLVDDTAVRDGRIALSLAVRQVIANGLSLLGVTAPERM